MKATADTLKTARQSMGMTQVQFAAALGAPTTTYEKWERDDHEPPAVAGGSLRALLWLRDQGLLARYLRDISDGR